MERARSMSRVNDRFLRTANSLGYLTRLKGSRSNHPAVPVQPATCSTFARMFIFSGDTLMELLQGMPLSFAAFIKLQAALIQRNEGHFHLSWKKTTTYKELW